MNSGEIEIYEAIRKVQEGPTVIRAVCIACEELLTIWDVQNEYAICGICRSIYFPPPKVEQRKAEPKATVIQLRGGKYAIIID